MHSNPPITFSISQLPFTFKELHISHYFFYLETICPTNWTSVFLLLFWKTGCSYVFESSFPEHARACPLTPPAAQVWKHFMRNNWRSVCSVSTSRGNVTLSGKRALCRQQLLLCGQHKWYRMTLNFLTLNI